MSESILRQIENSFSELSSSEQLRLIERLVHRLQNQSHVSASNVEEQLTLMAADPEIQNELRRIGQEFSPAEADGLERA